MRADIEKNPTEPVRQWLAAFERALSQSENGVVAGLFDPDGYWRDLLAFTWHIQTVRGADNIARALRAHVAETVPSDFAIDEDRTPPRLVTRAGTQATEAIFSFKTAIGRGIGVLRLLSDTDDGGPEGLKAWTLMTALDDIKGFEETVGERRPTGTSYSRDFHGPNWFDDRQTAIAFADRDPAVLVVGAGQAGLSIAARLAQLKVDTLVVDQEQRLGDNWRNRYHALSLHNQVHVNHLPYLPFPPTWPVYIPKDKLAGWFEAYADIMEINCWTETEFAGGAYDENKSCWSVTLKQNGGKVREMQPRHVIMATGASGIPNIPSIPGLEEFAGTVVHSSAYDQGNRWAGRKVLVIGTGTSGHDIAQDLYCHGAEVILVQRSPTMVVNIEPSAQLPYALYDEGPALEDCDLITASVPFQVMRKSHRLITEQIKVLDKDILDGLSAVGFRTDYSWDESGWQFKYLERGGGYYFNVGCSDYVVDGRIGLIQFADIESIVAEGARMRDGNTLAADLIVLATGYKGQEYLVRKLFGDAVADRVGPIWGFDGDLHELRNMFTRTGYPGLWFIAGSFAQCRIYSKYMALQIKACEEGMIPPVKPD